MSETKEGYVTGVRTTTKGDVLIDILGTDGAIYTDVPVTNTPGLNELPVPCVIPNRDVTQIDPQTGLVQLSTTEEIMSAKLNTTVYYELLQSGDYDVRGVKVIKFNRNYAFQTAGSPPTFMVKPSQGEVVVEAAGDGKVLGGHLHLQKNGNVILRSGSTQNSIEMNDAAGTMTVETANFTVNVAPFTITFTQGSMTITRNKYGGPGVSLPIVDATVSIDAAGNISAGVSPTGIGSLASITISQAGVVTVAATGAIQLGSGTQPFVKGSPLYTWLTTHVHATPSGPTTLITPLLLPTDILSTKILGE